MSELNSNCLLIYGYISIHVMLEDVEAIYSCL
jgi:hypothetical protein